MNTELTITTERVDDFVLLIKVMMRMGSASDTGSTYSAPLAAGGAELGMGGDDLAGAYHVAGRSPEIDGTGLGETGAHDVGRDDGIGAFETRTLRTTD